MNNNQNNLAGRAQARLLALALVLALSSCGGGGGNPGAVIGGGGNPAPGGGTGGGGTVPAAPTVTLAFVNAAGQPSNSLTGATPLTVKATVRDAAGKPVPNVIVAFATDEKLALFSPSAGTALTDPNGVASVTMRAASLAAGGAAKVTATSTVAGTTATAEGNYSVGATALSFGPLTATPSKLDAYGSTVLSVDLLANGAKYIDQQVNVNFSSACVAAGKATLASVVPTNNGTAQTVYRDQGCANNDVITVSADGVVKSATAALTIAPPAAASVQFASASPTDKSIVIRGQGGVGRTETATLTFKVFDTFNRPLAGQTVTFSTTSPYVTLNKTTDNTDQDGVVITTVNSGAVPTTFRVQATLKSGVSTLSDSIVVTTGQPVQRAMSLSATKSNVEGWSYDSGTSIPASVINVLLADINGNPVADGTPVVLQTNIGAIGSSDKGGCLTVNGGCSVDFRTQQPRVAVPGSPVTPCNSGYGATPDSTRPGVATICASSNDGTNTLSTKIALFLSDSHVAFAYLDGGSTPLSKTVATDLGSVHSDESKVFRLQFNDLHMNPMPVGSKVEITALANGTAVGVAPATVLNIFPHSDQGDDITGNNVSGAQGSTHTISLTSNQQKNCTGPATATFNVTVTTPLQYVTAFPFKLTFTCP
ncbi:Ig-like domain-containing protein [Massilia horti]|uniref:Big-1 domain-containing protein n=1 Tax=Massilia horti TaxID=2562153 RepID=A0A4Y9SZD4_9BURK|nr:Ig-like domain-containing protein [Massilia horti]TFW30739.1 hypothetical protein E4O92_15495 [Massilia horti]